MGRWGDRTVDRSEGPRVGRKVDRWGDRTVDRSGGPKVGRWGDRTEDRMVDRSEDRTVDLRVGRSEEPRAETVGASEGPVVALDSFRVRIQPMVQAC